ncbi:MAG: LuxR C-terminal-related transcriptional regulator [Nevskia sp.]|nr:LuxR C-terminal-related transcriptional regulator [Nevskia sp.]
MTRHRDSTLAGDVSLILEALVLLQEGDTEAASEKVAELRGSKNLSMISVLLCRGHPFSEEPRLCLAQRRFLSVLGEKSARKWGERRVERTSRDSRVKPDARDALLTSKKVVVLRSVKEGLTNIDVAARLGVSTNTIKWHLKELFRELGVNNRRALVHQAELRGLI